jgi:hypothetical protein
MGREGETLVQRAERLRKVVGTRSEKEIAAEELAQVEAQLAARDHATLQENAKDYIRGEVRAISSLVGEPSTLDETRLLAAAEAFRDAVQKVDERFTSILARRHSLRAVVEVFGLPTPDLPPVTPPALRKTVQDAFTVTSMASVRDHGFTQPTTDNDGRRTFEEPELSEAARALLRRKNGQR